MTDSPHSAADLNHSLATGLPRPIEAVRRRGLWVMAAMVGMGLLALGTRAGIGTFGDSVTYYTAAKSLLAGAGLKQQAVDGSPMPLLQFPPAYPIALAAIAKIGGDVLAAARDINVLSLGLSVFLIGYIIWRLSRSAIVSGAAALLFAVHGQVMGLYIRMFSEPMYLVLMLCVIAIFIRFGPRGRWLVVAGCAAGVAILTRFAGVHLAGCVAIWLVLMNWRHGWRISLRRLAAFLIPALLPAIAWSIRNMVEAGHSTSRTLAYHPPKWIEVQPLFDAMKFWIIPTEGPWQYPALIIVLALWLIVPVRMIYIYGLPRRGGNGRLMLTVIFVLTYVPFLWIARTFFDSAIPFNYRLLIPLHPMSLIVVAIWVTRLWRRWPERATVMPRVALGCAGVLFAAIIAQQAYSSFELMRKTGVTSLGYGTKQWSQSAGMAAIRNLPPDTVIYTNAADAVYLLTGRTACTLPLSYGYDRTRGKAVVEHGLVRLYKAMSREQAVAIYFSAVKRNTIMISEKQLVARVHEAAFKQLADARIYSIEP